MNFGRCSRIPLVCGLVAWLAGCDGNPQGNPQMADALTVLKSGLDAWKNGGTPAALDAGANPVQFTDPDWKAGAKLTEYKVLKVGEEDGETAYTVNLTLDVKGKAVEKAVSYRISMTPKQAVTRAVGK